ncbi:hypothetical protein DPMN_141166 [Dreissena polymorpha]|uniref:Uncharacterized protein n=1 Tax=Dreissena polymorpha TaxID=45954 RepID=A0A9D4GC95_DREPO|nr:hypothetical protein DPMN_141166 [Dreissena polymorpha]
MAQQRPTGAPGLVMGSCIVEIDRIFIRDVQYQLEVNRLKGNFGLVWPMWAGRPRIGRIGMRIVQYQLEVNRCRNEEIIVKCNFGWVWPIRAGRPRIDRIVIREVQYQLEVNRCRNEEVIVKGNFGWVWPMWVGRLRVGNGAMHIDIDRIVIREFQYQIEVNRCRNEEFIVKGNFGWLWSMWTGRPRIDRIVKREVQYQFEFQGSGAYRRTDRRSDRRTVEITTTSPCFSKSSPLSQDNDAEDVVDKNYLNMQKWAHRRLNCPSVSQSVSQSRCLTWSCLTVYRPPPSTRQVHLSVCLLVVGPKT